MKMSSCSGQDRYFHQRTQRYVKAVTERIDARDNFPAVAIGRHHLYETTGGGMGR